MKNGIDHKTIKLIRRSLESTFIWPLILGKYCIIKLYNRYNIIQYIYKVTNIMLQLTLGHVVFVQLLLLTRRVIWYELHNMLLHLVFLPGDFSVKYFYNVSAVEQNKWIFKNKPKSKKMIISKLYCRTEICWLFMI